jgi:hypothetical protein
MVAMVGARFLPDRHLSAESKNAVSASMAVVGTLSALVLGLFLSTGNTSFQAKNHQVTQISTNIIGLDRVLRRYGAESKDIRALLRRYAASQLQDMFPKNSSRPDFGNDATMSKLEELQNMILALAPANDTQRWLQSQALQLTGALTSTRWQLVQENESRIPPEITELIMFWFVIIFAGFGLFAPRNFIAVAAIFLCSVGIGSAVRMATELQTPFEGLIRIPDASLVRAVDLISRSQP